MEAESDTMIRLPVVGHLTYREWHAFVNGFYRGFTALKGEKHEYSKEKHYWRTGFVFGWVVKLGILMYAVPKLNL